MIRASRQSIQGQALLFCGLHEYSEIQQITKQNLLGKEYAQWHDIDNKKTQSDRMNHHSGFLQTYS
jgi:hypothetical protein